MSDSARKFLVVAPAWIGDMIMSQVIYSTIRKRVPDAAIDVLAPKATLSLVPRMSEVDRGILIKQGHGEFGLGYRRALGKHLADNRYDQAIITPNSLKSALVPFFADIPVRTGFLGEYRYFLVNDLRLLDKKRLPLMTDRFLALVDETGDNLQAPSLIVDKENQQAFIKAQGLHVDRPRVGFCPGAEFGDAKKWPEEHYIALAKALVASGKSVWIFGSPADRETGEQIAAAVGDHCVNLAGATSILDAIDLLAMCETVVTNDSGLMHIAAAVGTSVVGLYGSTSPEFTPPITEKAQIIRIGLDCSPCFKRECPLGHKQCLTQLSPGKVLSALEPS
jgi:heptosyltransferase-2